MRVLATHSIRQFPLHLPYRASPCATRFRTSSTYTETRCWKGVVSTTSRQFFSPEKRGSTHFAGIWVDIATGLHGPGKSRLGWGLEHRIVQLSVDTNFTIVSSSLACCMPYPTHPPRFDHSYIIWLTEQIIAPNYVALSILLNQ